MKTAELLRNQVVNGTLWRLDIIVRYLAIEEMFGGNDYGLALYRKMQERRVQHPKTVAEFRTLVDSIRGNGIDPIPIAGCGLLQGGAHRLACALYFGVGDLPVRRVLKYGGWYGVSWFWKNGFSFEEIDLIQKRQEEIFKQWGIDLDIIYHHLLRRCCKSIVWGAELFFGKAKLHCLRTLIRSPLGKLKRRLIG